MKRSKVWMLASILALGGMSVSTVGAPLLTVQAAEEVVAANPCYAERGGSSGQQKDGRAIPELFL